MKISVDLYDFRRAFEKYGRDNFSHEGLAALFDYLDRLEEETGEEMELDVIAFCCDFAEYDSIADFRENYGDKYETMQDIEERTSVIPIPGTDRFIVASF